MSKKLTIIVTLFALPFLFVWFTWLLTAMSFNPREVFQGGAFWGLSMIYWLLWVCTIGVQVEMVNEFYDKKPAK